MFSGLGSAVNPYDATGHYARLLLGVGTDSLIGLPPAVLKAEQNLFSVGALQKIRLLGYNPYPAPGQSNGTAIGRNSLGQADAQNTFQRVDADC